MSAPIADIVAQLRNFSAGAIVGSLFLTFLISLVGVLFYRRFFHPLARIPGPAIASITGIWRTRRLMLGGWHDDIIDLHKRYGRVVRIAPDEISLVDAAAAKVLYGAGGAYAPKTDWYDTWTFGPDQAPGIFQTTDRNIHGFLRKRVSAPYSMTGVLKYEAHVQKCLDELWKQLATRAAGGEYIADMAKWTNALAFDVVGELAFGEWLGHLAAGAADVENLRGTILQGFIAASTMGHIPGQTRLVVNRYVAGLLALFGSSTPMAQFQQWALKRIQTRLDDIADGKGESRDDMLTHFCRMKAKDGGPASVPEILAECGNIIGAGADTVSIGMRACIYHLGMSDPRFLATLRAEVDAFYDEHNGAAPTYLETQQMPYLVAVVREATRLFPSIPFQLLRHVPKTGLEVDGYRLREGTRVGVSAIAANRDPAIWGADAEEFRPER